MWTKFPDYDFLLPLDCCQTRRSGKKKDGERSSWDILLTFESGIKAATSKTLAQAWPNPECP